jgi:hypothetical protein
MKKWSELTSDEQLKFGSEEGYDLYVSSKKAEGMEDGDILKSIAASNKAEIEEANAFNKKQQEQQTKVSNTAGDVYNATQALNTLGQIGSGISKMRQGKEGLAKTEGQRPDMPQDRGNLALRDNISSAQYDASKGLSDSAMGSLSKQNLSAYANAINAAKTLGQSGAVQSQNQNLFINALKNQSNLAVSDHMARQQNKARLDGLIGVQEGARQKNLDRLTLDRQGKLQDWRQKMVGYQALKATGEQNLQNQLATLPYKMANWTNDYYMFNQQRGRTPDGQQPLPVAPMPEYQGNTLPQGAYGDSGTVLQQAPTGTPFGGALTTNPSYTGNTLPQQAYGTPNNVIRQAPSNSPWDGFTGNNELDFQ